MTEKMGNKVVEDDRLSLFCSHSSHLILYEWALCVGVGVRKIRELANSLRILSVLVRTLNTENRTPLLSLITLFSHSDTREMSAPRPRSFSSKL